MDWIGEIKDYIKHHISPGSIVIIGSIFLYSVGFFIHNHYLSTYKVANFDLIKGKYIYTGITYLLFVALSSFFLTFNLSFSSDPHSNFEIKNFFRWLWRFEGFLILTYSVFPGKETGLFDNTNISVFGLFNIPGDDLNRYCTSFGFMFLSWIIFLVATRNTYTKEKANKYDLLYSFILFIPFTFIVLWGFLFDSLFRRLFGFCAIIMFYIFARILGAANPSPSLPTDESIFFRDKATPLRRIVERKIFSFLFTIYLLVFSISLYSKYIYSMLPNSFGGAKPVTVSITLTDNKTIEAKLIDETEKEIIILQDQEKLVSVIGKNNVIRSDIKLIDFQKEDRQVSPFRRDRK